MKEREKDAKLLKDLLTTFILMLAFQLGVVYGINFAVMDFTQQVLGILMFLVISIILFAGYKYVKKTVLEVEN